MSAIDPPTCCLCGKPHWQRAGCDFGKNTSREGRAVVKPKGTATDRDHLDAQPATPRRETGKTMTKADKVRTGKLKTARKAKKGN